MKRTQYFSKSEHDTLVSAQKLSQTLKGGEVITLKGQLGAGKTVFVKGLAKGLGIRQIITSPTFILLKVYRIRKSRGRVKRLVHVDTYRVSKAQDLIDIGILDYLGKNDTITVIEWPEKVQALLKRLPRIEVRLELGKNEEERRIVVKKGAGY